MTDDALNEWLNERFGVEVEKGETHKFNLQFARDLIAFARQQDGLQCLECGKDVEVRTWAMSWRDEELKVPVEWEVAAWCLSCQTKWVGFGVSDDDLERSLEGEQPLNEMNELVAAATA